MNRLITSVSLAISFALAQGISAKDYIITSHGVTNDSTKIQTAAFQKVIDMAEAAGGGRIIVPKGTYLTGALLDRKSVV